MLFYPQELFDEGHCQVRFKEEVYSTLGSQKGSFNVLPARLLGLSYPDYLRYARDFFNGRIKANGGFPVVDFSNEKDCENLCKKLQEQWDALIKEV